MASNETIQNLATLLSALRGFNQPRREMEMYAQKAMIDLSTRKELAQLEYDRLDKKEQDLLRDQERLAKIQQAKLIAEDEDYVPFSQVLEDIGDVKASVEGGILKSIKGKSPEELTALEVSQFLPVGQPQATKFLAQRRYSKIINNQAKLISFLGDDIGAAKTASRRGEVLSNVLEYENALNKLSNIANQGYYGLSDNQLQQTRALLGTLNEYKNILSD